MQFSSNYLLYSPINEYKYLGDDFASCYSSCILKIKNNIDKGFLIFDGVFLYRNFSNPRLYYHTPLHILAGLQFLKLNLIEISNTQILAWFFHDSVYIPGRPFGENERDSFFFFKKHVQNYCFSQEQIDDVENAIMATSLHNVDKLIGYNDIIIDLDLHNFACSEECFSNAGKLIRLEYPDVSDQDYNVGRNKFLQSLYNRKYIFRTELFRDLFEERARSNIKNVLLK